MSTLVAVLIHSLIHPLGTHGLPSTVSSGLQTTSGLSQSSCPHPFLLILIPRTTLLSSLFTSPMSSLTPLWHFLVFGIVSTVEESNCPERRKSSANQNSPWPEQTLHWIQHHLPFSQFVTRSSGLFFPGTFLSQSTGFQMVYFSYSVSEELSLLSNITAQSLILSYTVIFRISEPLPRVHVQVLINNLPLKCKETPSSLVWENSIFFLRISFEDIQDEGPELGNQRNLVLTLKNISFFWVSVRIQVIIFAPYSY